MVSMRRTSRSQYNRLLRWIFRRGNHLLVCELARYAGGRRYTLSLVPLWDREHSDRESFDTGMKAFHRHAEIAAQLREFGWKVVAYTSGVGPPGHRLALRPAA